MARAKIVVFISDVVVRTAKGHPSFRKVGGTAENLLVPINWGHLLVARNYLLSFI